MGDDLPAALPEDPGGALALPEDPGGTLDLAAAQTRADGDDTQAMLDALAVRLSGALPRMTTVKRRRVGGLLSKRTEVERIEVQLSDERFEIVNAAGMVRCARNRVVRGITLKRDEVAIEDWVRGLVEEVTRTATLGEQARMVLEGLVK